MANSLRVFFKSFLAEGIFLIILGTLILFLPKLTTITLAMLLSVAAFFIGVYKLVNSIVMRKEIANPWLSILISLLLIGLGVYLTMNPFFNIVVLTMAIGIYFILEGANSIVVAIKNRKIMRGWWLTLLSAILLFLAAAFIIFGLPFTALWTIGMVIGITMIIAGITAISLYLGSKDYSYTYEY